MKPADEKVEEKVAGKAALDERYSYEEQRWMWMQTRQPMLSRAPPRGTSCQLSPADSLRIYIAAKAEAQRARSSQPAMPTTEEK